MWGGRLWVAFLAGLLGGAGAELDNAVHGTAVKGNREKAVHTKQATSSSPNHARGQAAAGVGR